MKKIITIVLGVSLYYGISLGSQTHLNIANELIESHSKRLQNIHLTQEEIHKLKEEVTKDPKGASEHIIAQTENCIEAEKLIFELAKIIRQQCAVIDLQNKKITQIKNNMDAHLNSVAKNLPEQLKAHMLKN